MIGRVRGWIKRLRGWMHDILRQHLTPESVGLAVAIGIFLGCLPFYGVHILMCIGVARAMKLNQALVYAACNISNPFFAPFLISFEILLGDWLRFGHTSGRTLNESGFWTMLKTAPDLFWSCLVGSLVLGGVLGVVLGLLAMGGMRRWGGALRAGLGEIPGPSGP